MRRFGVIKPAYAKDFEKGSVHSAAMLRLIIRTQIMVMCASTLTITGCSKVITVEEHIRQQVKETDGVEYRPARRYAEGGVDGDGISDTAVIYTLESFRRGSIPRRLLLPQTVGRDSTYAQFLAVSLSSTRTVCFTQVAGKGIRDADAVALARGHIDVVLREYAPTDAMCCPSVPATTRYVLKDGAFVESKSK